ncbi:MAG: VCBS repeat-containing protein, partial [Planctomycetales bacterium]|nr:VCBS repeat-containing protein [Planctomycetales bacterium]
MRRPRLERLEDRRCLTMLGFADLPIDLPIGDGLAADFNGDGRDDFAFSTSPGVAIRWAETDQVGLSDEQIIGDYGDLIGVHDIDADGDVDLIAASSSSMVWLENDRAANRFVIHEVPGAPTMAHSSSELFRAADVDGDGKLDFVYLANSQQLVTVSNVAEPTIIIASVPMLPADVTLQLGDINSDGDLDALIQEDRFSGAQYWYEWNGASFVEGMRPAGLPADGRHFEMLDWDNDQQLDLFRQHTSSVQRYEFNVVSQQFVAAESIFFGIFYDLSKLTFGDHDGDGHPDLFVAERLQDALSFHVVAQSSLGTMEQPKYLSTQGASLVGNWQ